MKRVILAALGLSLAFGLQAKVPDKVTPELAK